MMPRKRKPNSKRRQAAIDRAKAAMGPTPPQPKVPRPKPYVNPVAAAAQARDRKQLDAQTAWRDRVADIDMEVF